MKTAFTEMTTQLVNTIQAAFRGVRGTPVKETIEQDAPKVQKQSSEMEVKSKK